MKKDEQQDAELTFQSHWYKSILNAIPFPITVTDENMNWTFVNKAVEDFLGTKMEDMLGKPCSNWNAHICNTPDCGIACAKRGLKRTFFTHDGASYQVDVEILKKIDGTVAGFIEVVQDITKLKEMEEEALSASKAKSQFLSSMSHEMRTPMNAIIGMAAIGLNAADIEQKNNALKKIEDASKHLLGVINDVLDMSKIEANKLDLSHIAFDLKHLLHKAVSFVQFSMDDKGLIFSMNVDSNAPSFFVGDDQRLTQVIANLLSNALKFTPKGGKISLDVIMLGEENGTCELRFEVADTGIGIAPDQQEKIFNAFEQAESGITRKFGGTGLGLVITKRIIELMGGKIWVESELGKGARFIFTIKLKCNEKDSTSQSEVDEIDSVITKELYEKLKEKKLLVVEDLEINREILISLLDNTGLIIETAENGEEALDMVASDPQKFDLIFMDVQMPVMDGLEATRQIRALPELSERKLPIIAMTANVFQEDIENCYAAGMDDHIGKPLEMAKVLMKLYEYL
jgi:PAS domain S-box-containing protein